MKTVKKLLEWFLNGLGYFGLFLCGLSFIVGLGSILEVTERVVNGGSSRYQNPFFEITIKKTESSTCVLSKPGDVCKYIPGRAEPFMIVAPESCVVISGGKEFPCESRVVKK